MYSLLKLNAVCWILNRRRVSEKNLWFRNSWASQLQVYQHKTHPNLSEFLGIAGRLDSSDFSLDVAIRNSRRSSNFFFQYAALHLFQNISGISDERYK